jgi:DNA-binding transcriptional MerR regulator
MRALGPPRPGLDHGVYGISVAAELVGMGVQTLRLYEARGLLEPGRTAGGTRRYSENDLERLRRIGVLLDAGLNIAGIAMVLELEKQNAQLRADKQERSAAAPSRPRKRPPPTGADER